MGIAEKLSAGEPGETKWREELFFCHKQIGEVLEARGDGARALAEFEKSLAIAQRMTTNGLAEASWQEHLLQSHLKVGDARRALGDKAGAQGAYKAALTTGRALAGTDTNNAAWQLDLAVCYGRLGSLRLEEAGAEPAMVPCQTSLQIAQRFAGRNPANSQWQSILADSHDNLGDVLLAHKETKAAVEHYEKALEIRQGLAANDPADTRWQRDLLRSQFNIARAQAYESKGSKRLKIFLAGWKPLVSLTKAPVDVGRQVFAAYDKEGKRLEPFRKTMDEARQLADKDPGNIQWQEDLASYHSSMGDMLLGARKPENALSEYRAALGIRKQLANRDTNAAPLQYGLALAHANVAAALRRLARPAEALAEARETLDLLAGMASRWPGNFVLTEGPGVREGNIRYKLRLGPDQQEDFRAVFTQGFDEAKAALATDSRNPSLAEQWGRCCAEKAVFALFYGDVAEAADYSKRAAEMWQNLSRAVPGNAEYRTHLMRAYLALGAFQLLSRQPQEAVKTSQAALRLDPTRADANALLVLGCLAADQYEKARVILVEYKDLKVGPRRTFFEAILEDLRRLQEKGVAQVDVGKIERRLAEGFPAASE